MANTKFASAGNYPAGSDDWSGQPRQVALTISEAKQGFTPNEPIPAEVLNYLFAAVFPDVQIITANETWTKPENAVHCQIRMIGEGGGSGSGGTQGGGGGGSSGELLEVALPASELPATLTATITGLGGDVQLSGTGITLRARVGYPGSNGTGSVGGDGASLAPDANDGSAGAGGNGAVGAPGGGMMYQSKSAGGGGGGDTNFAGGAGGRGDCNVGRGPSSSGVPGVGGRGYGAGAGGGAGGGANGGGGGSGGSGIGSQLLALTGGFAVGAAGGAGHAAGAPGVIIVTTWRGIP